MGPKRHIFVCVQKRPPFAKPSCGLRDSQDLLAALAEEVAAAGLAADVAVTGTMCLGPCESGPSLVVYPEGIWYAGVRPADAKEIVVSHARSGKPVERLVYRWPQVG